ncbi:hypothetical protein [Staphylococcus borealis]|uniref:hypothetical protein n=1 Tax=Staphylococcus borealis TaxID=2742203 RepID=UPI0039C737DC
MATIQNGLNAFSEGLLDSNTGLAVFLFGFIKRLLIPFGYITFSMHHSGLNLVLGKMLLER